MRSLTSAPSSPISVGCIEPVGILYASTTKYLRKSAIATAITAASMFVRHGWRCSGLALTCGSFSARQAYPMATASFDSLAVLRLFFRAPSPSAPACLGRDGHRELARGFVPAGVGGGARHDGGADGEDAPRGGRAHDGGGRIGLVVSRHREVDHFSGRAAEALEREHR